MHKLAPWTVVVASSPAPTDPAELMAWGQIAAAVVEIVWVTEVFRQARVVPQNAAAPLAAAQGE